MQGLRRVFGQQEIESPNGDIVECCKILEVEMLDLGEIGQIVKALQERWPS